MISKVLDVPYGNHFEHHESWTVLSTSDTAIKCILRGSDRLKMLQKTMFEGQIRSRSEKDFLDYFAKWMKAIEEKGFM